jgi:hypothetical protein
LNSKEGDLDLLFKAAQTDPVVAEAIDNAQTPQDLAPILQSVKENQQEQVLESPTSDQKKSPVVAGQSTEQSTEEEGVITMPIQPIKAPQPEKNIRPYAEKNTKP